MDFNNKDLLNDIPTLDDLCKMLADSFVERIKKDPIDFANKLRKDNIIDDEQYKEMVMNIKNIKIDEDF